jgi:uncharacterized lipoprotein YmbA
MNARLFCGALFMAMTACSTAPEIHYYTLSAEPSSIGTATASPRGSRASYAIDTVTIPDLLDRPQIVVRTGANAVDVLDNDRWGAPLADQLRRILAADLSARLGTNAIADPGLPISLRFDRRISISILTFDPGRDSDSVLEASWELSDPKSAPLGGGTRTYRARHIASTKGATVPEIVATMSGLVTMVADDIAATVAADE